MCIRDRYDDSRPVAFDPAHPESGGNSLDLNFGIQVNDGHNGTATQPVNIHIEGTNDGPQITGDKVHLREEGVQDVYKRQEYRYSCHPD